LLSVKSVLGEGTKITISKVRSWDKWMESQINYKKMPLRRNGAAFSIACHM
jgi:hypothetical protein